MYSAQEPDGPCDFMIFCCGIVMVFRLANSQSIAWFTSKLVFARKVHLLEKMGGLQGSNVLPLSGIIISRCFNFDKLPAMETTTPHTQKHSKTPLRTAQHLHAWGHIRGRIPAPQAQHSTYQVLSMEPKYPQVRPT